MMQNSWKFKGLPLLSKALALLNKSLGLFLTAKNPSFFQNEMSAIRPWHKRLRDASGGQHRTEFGAAKMTNLSVQEAD